VAWELNFESGEVGHERIEFLNLTEGDFMTK
jgi:hypothetical protein